MQARVQVAGPERSEGLRAPANCRSAARARAWRGSASASETSRRGRRRDFSGGLGDTIHVAALTTWTLSCRRRAPFLVAVPVESRSVSARHHPGPWGSVVGPGDGHAICRARVGLRGSGQGILRVRNSMAGGLRCGRSPRRDWSQAKRADSDHRGVVMSRRFGARYRLQGAREASRLILPVRTGMRWLHRRAVFE